MIIDPSETTAKDFHALLLGSVSPRPIALASTVDKDGNVNLSPFSFFNAFSIHPPVLIFSAARKVRDNTTKHTLDNILETNEVVINTVNFPMVEQVSLASTEYAKGVNEFIKAGLTEVPSIKVKPPRVRESPVSFECKVQLVQTLGHEGGAGNLIFCEIVLVHAHDSIFDENKRIDPHKIDLVARMGADYYCRASGSNVFEIPKPIMTKGIGIDQLPKNIRESRVLTGNNLGRLANIEKIPSPEEVKLFRESVDVEFLNHAQGENKEIELHRYAQSLLQLGEIKKAWLVLLSTDENF